MKPKTIPKITVTPFGYINRNEYIKQTTIFHYETKRIAHLASNDKKSFIVVNGKEGKKYLHIGKYQFSPDGKHLIYEAGENRKRFIVIDDEEGKHYDDIMSPEYFYSPDGNRIVYAAKEKGKWFIVDNGVEGEKYDLISDIYYDKNSKVVIYTVHKFGESYMIFKEKEEKKYSFDKIHGEERYESYTLSHDKPEAFEYKKGKKYIVRVDGVDGKKYDEIMADVNTYDTIFMRGSNILYYYARNENSVYLVEYEWSDN